MPKQKLTLSIDKEIITQAKKQQINLSSFLEIRLVDYLNYKECSRRDSPLIVQCPPNINSNPQHHNHQVIMLQMYFYSLYSLTSDV
jgi:predicted DNA-binding ribbon-helix-helix protein